MPFLRSPNGSKIAFSQARLSSLLSLVYVEAWGDKTPKYRATIQKHCVNIWGELTSLYGSSENDEWPGPGIYRHIEAELREQADTAVHEAFLSLKINEFQDHRKKSEGRQRKTDSKMGVVADGSISHPNSHPNTYSQEDLHPNSGARETPWDRFEAKPLTTASTGFKLHDQVDPLWAIVIGEMPDSHVLTGAQVVPLEADTADAPPLTRTRKSLSDKNLSDPNDRQRSLEKPSSEAHSEPFAALSARMGVAARAEGAGIKPKKQQHIVAVQRSHWIRFWKSLPKKHIPWEVWEKHIASLGLDQKHLSPQDWWLFWQDAIDTCMVKDPRVHELRRALHERQKRAAITNQSWLEGTELWYQDAPLKLENTPTGQVWYKRLGVEHLKKVFAFTLQHDHLPVVDWDWQMLHRALKPERDGQISWRAWQYFDEAGALWGRLPVWSTGEKPHPDATEMPQWAMMRVAMHMAYLEGNPANATQNALELYEQISRQFLIPSAAIWREAGKEHPHFFEDAAWWVDDKFLDIQKVIYSNAVDTVWTGTVSSTWNHVRSKNAPVRAGRRKSTGVNDFLRTIDAHMKAQGRMGEERPVTTLLPCWHLDVEEFISLRHEDAQRLQTTLLVTDLFMQRVAENSTWSLFDPSVYPEVTQGKEGYLQAEKNISERKKKHPQAHRTVQADKMWKKLLNLMRLGSPFVTFEDSDLAYAVSDQHPLVHGLDGVGAFSVFEPHESQHLSWPSMAVNINAMMSEEGEPLLEEWRETLTWAFWMAERVYEANADQLSEATLNSRPLCLGAVGVYEAIQKATISNNNPEDVGIWVSKISEAWGALITMVDQVFCQKHGPAPIWFNQKVETFHPHRNYEKLKRMRGGGVGVPQPPEQISELYNEIKAHRYSVRTVWAPFKQLACWAGVSPGGFGTLFPVEWVMDEKRVWRLTPTHFLNDVLYKDKHPETFGEVFAHPENPSKWPTYVRKMAVPDMEEWKVRLKHASLVRPWVEQGVSLTLPSGMPVGQLSILLQQAWWMGMSSVRFEDTFRRPDIQYTKPTPEDDEG